MEENSEDMLQLGGNIQLSGFKNVDRSMMVVLKKIVGSHVKRYGDICQKFESLTLTMKPVHQTEQNVLYELHAKCMDNGKPIVAEGTDRNLFVILDDVLKKVESEIQK